MPFYATDNPDEVQDGSGNVYRRMTDVDVETDTWGIDIDPDEIMPRPAVLPSERPENRDA